MTGKQTRGSLFLRLRAGLKEGIAFAKGDLSLRTTVIPDSPPPMTAKDVSALRAQMNVSQGVLAKLLNVSAKTVQSWEQGSRSPSQASLRLLQILKCRPEVVAEVVGLKPQNGRTSRSRSLAR
jgi:putative transcriptional regulator